MIEIGIIGGAGYTAGELIRVFRNHPRAKINFVYSTSNAGNFIHQIHRDLAGETDLRFTKKINKKVAVVFLCLGHGNSKKFLEHHSFCKTTKIIDLSNDFRLQKNSQFENKNFVYGLPEVYKKEIQQAQCVANPGCFATAIQLGLLPLYQNQKITDSVHINATTGVTGAGVTPTPTNHFAWRDNNFSVYKTFTHQHLSEIKETLDSLQKNDTDLLFIPNRGNFSRGIFASIYTKFEDSITAAQKMYEDFYKESPFTYISDAPIALKQVVNTNKCLIHLEKKQGYLLIYSALDNLLKGASGQAVENMNLMSGFPQKEGLHLKGSGF